MSIQHTEILLQQATTIRRAQELVGEQPGASFNIFQILGLASSEVFTHSSLLAEMLNPHGSHGVGGIFLKLWLEMFGIQDFDIKSATCNAEYYIGPKTETTGGRIDILLDDGNQKIVIENKIYASDQPNQLLRYYHFNQQAKLFYLTLFGTNPGEESTGKGALSADAYTCISYADHILSWLELCRKEAAHIPTLRETITQYIDLIKKLTHQHFNGKMQQELVQKILTSSDHLTSFIELQSQGLNKAVYSQITSKWKDDLEKMADGLNMKLNFYFEERVKWHGFTLSNDDLAAWHIWIDFQFAQFPNGLNFGFSYPPNNGKPDKPAFSLEPLYKRFKEVYPRAKSHEWWLVYNNWSSYSAEEVCRDIYFSDAFITKTKAKVAQMLEMVNAAKIEVERV